MYQATRYVRERRHLALLDDRLLDDVGLDCSALDRGVLFLGPSPPHPASHPFWKRTP